MKELTKADERFIADLILPYFKVRAIIFEVIGDRKEWPDIKVEMGNPPKVTANQTWARQSPSERMKRVVHECLHLKGIGHNEAIGYSTVPAQDRFSRLVYNDIVAHRDRILEGKYFFNRRRFGL